MSKVSTIQGDSSGERKDKKRHRDDLDRCLYCDILDQENLLDITQLIIIFFSCYGIEVKTISLSRLIVPNNLSLNKVLSWVDAIHSDNYYT